MEQLTALFQAEKVRTDRRKPAALAAVLAAVMLITSACTPGAPTDTSDPVQSNTPQPTESASAELSQDWLNGRLYRRGWQVDYQLALPEEYSGCDVVLRVDEKSQVLFQAGEESRPEVTAENLTADWVVASSTLEFPQSSGSVMLREIEAVG